ncbi:Vacuolar protein sorting-associated protein VTA1 -like protein [Trichinella zimbabwensis]|uniref:Vacuolar protein sorting-associated protein VTA1-like protein n=1 Tax=Trichinella zimbabwensis TaxID=268475 RepID=A0A0V1HFQ3_9BILA|nr:Vacuolar protein sorting-associated protein VTA1 -like protein [Trichinella zimbabwensis]
MVMGRLPEAFKSLKPFLKIAEDNAKCNVAVEYWCLRYVYGEALTIDTTSPECKSFICFLLSYLSKLERDNKKENCFCNEDAAQKYLKRVALRFFQKADRLDRSRRFTIDVAKYYITAANLINVLSVFGDLDNSLIEARKYGRWRGAYLFNMFNDLEYPLPAPEEVNESLEKVRYHGDITEWDSFDDTYDVFLSVEIAVPLNYSEIPDDGVSTNVELEEALERFADFNEAYKYGTSAMSELQDQNFADAILNLENALELMQKYKRK